MYETQTPYVASYIIIRKGNKIAFVLRENTKWMNGYYGLPSGKIENNESAVDAAIREAYEETGINVKAEDLEFTHVAHRNSDSQWIDFYFEAKAYEGEPYNAEPDVHGELAWFSIDEIPEKTVYYIKPILQSIKSGSKFSQVGF